VQFEVYVLAPVWGSLVIRFGYLAPMLAGTALLGVGFLVKSQLNSLLVFCLGAIIAGLGFSAYLTVPIAAIGNCFQAHRGLAIAVATAGFGLSGFMAPILNWGIEGYGWRAVYVAAGLAMIMIGAPLCLLFRHTPENQAHVAEGESIKVNKDGEALPGGDRSLTGREALRTPALWLLALLYALSLVPASAIVPHMVSYLVASGIERSTAVLGVSGLAAAIAIGSIGGGALADRREKRHVLVGALIVMTLGTLIFATISESWQLLLFLIVAGPAWGALLIVTPALVADYFGARSFALILGIVYAPGPFIWFPVPPAVAWSSNHFGTYQPAWLALAVLMLATAALGLLLRPPRTPRQLSVNIAH